MTPSALRELLSLADIPEPEAGMVEITGPDDPILPTRYRITQTGAAGFAAVGVAASELWHLKTGRRQQVKVDTREAAAALRGANYLKINGQPAPREHDPMGGFHRIRDGRWIMLHCGFQHLRDRAAAVLGVPPEREAVSKAALSWDGEELETALMEGGACGAFVRTPEEWDATPQAKALADIPLLEIVKIGDAPPEPLPAGARPLSGVRVLDLTRVIAGPSCARALAEHGADVLKISRRGLADSGALDIETGLGKLSAFLDLREPAEDGKLRELVKSADIFSQSYRVGALAGRGFSPEDVAAMRPGIVYVTLNAWGHGGPWGKRRGYDTVVQSASGMAFTQTKDGVPAFQPVSVLDYVGGCLMAMGAMAALHRRATEGGSWLVRTSLAGCRQWISGKGLLPESARAGAPTEVPAEILARLATERQDTPFGPIVHLAPVAHMSETPSFWARPPVPLGHSPAAWPARAG